MAEDLNKAQALVRAGGSERGSVVGQESLEALLGTLRELHWQQHTEADAAQRQRSELAQQLQHARQAGAAR